MQHILIGEGWVGSAQAFMMVLFGDLFDAFGSGNVGVGGTDLTSQTDEIVIKMAAIGAINLVAAWIGSMGFRVSGLRYTACSSRLYFSLPIPRSS